MGIIYDSRPISELNITEPVLAILEDANIVTIGDLQKRFIAEEKIHLIGPRRHDYLVEKLSHLGLSAKRPWTDRLHELVFGREDQIATITTKGERELASCLVKWLYIEHNIPYSNARANPLFVFCARIGCGKIERSLPGKFDDYQEYKLVAWENGRFDYRVLNSGQIARLTDVPIEEIHRIYQRCLSFLRSDDITLNLSTIFRTYAEDRK